MFIVYRNSSTPFTNYQMHKIHKLKLDENVWLMQTDQREATTYISTGIQTNYRWSEKHPSVKMKWNTSENRQSINLHTMQHSINSVANVLSLFV